MMERIFLIGYYYYKLKKKRKYFARKLNLEGRRRRQRGLNRNALLGPKDSPWQKLFDSKDDPALITVTGLDHAAFDELLHLYRPLFLMHYPWTGDMDGTNCKRIKSTKGRKRIINAEASLGLVLAWHRFRGSESILQGWFGFAHTHNNVWLRFGRRMLLKALRKHPEAKAVFPTDEEIRNLQSIALERHDCLEGVCCFMDGLKLCLQQAGDDDVQGMCYNDWTHDHCITNLFLFSVCGRIIACVVNAPGSLHDSTLAGWGGVCDVLRSTFERMGGKCCVDSAFASAKAECLVQSAQDVTKADTAIELLVNKQATSLRQAAEWGMRAIQSSMPRLRDRFHYEQEEKEIRERELVMKLVPLLYNYRLEFVGLNQLRNTYVRAWSRDADFFINND